MPVPENVIPALAQALADRGYESLTPVQEAVLEDGLESVDLIVSAQTGSGKTVAFGLALATDLLEGKERFDSYAKPLALVIAPTRELALQVKRELDWLYAPAGAKVISCVGGMDPRDERRALDRGAHIVVGTPGRLVDHIRRKSLVMNDLKAVVLDEADEMLNMGFREELETILEAAPDDRRTLMFSATMPRAIEALARKYQNDAVRVNTIAAKSQHHDIEYKAVMAANHDAENAIFNVLRYHEPTNVIVFCGTRVAVSRLTSRLANRGLSVVALSGELSQAERSHALQALRDGRAQVCVATDVAARGIDLPGLELVIHADLPRNREALLHRSGRTGRAGQKGTSVLIVPPSGRRRTDRMLKDAGIDAKWGAPPSPEDVRARDNERLLGNAMLSEPVADSDQEMIAKLLEQHGAEQIASAFMRLYSKGKAAPEEIAPVPDRPDRNDRRDRNDRGRPERGERPPREPRNDFENGVWVSLSVGRKQTAEPRWLIPMLCKAGGLTKKDIGSIRIEHNETHIELDPATADSFFEQVGKDGQLEKSIKVKRLEGEPPASAPRKPREGGLGRPDRDGDRPRRKFVKGDSASGKPPFKGPRKEHRPRNDQFDLSKRPKPQDPTPASKPKVEATNETASEKPASRYELRKAPTDKPKTKWTPAKKGRSDDGWDGPKRPGSGPSKDKKHKGSKGKPSGGKAKVGKRGGMSKTPPTNRNKRKFKS